METKLTLAKATTMNTEGLKFLIGSKGMIMPARISLEPH